MRALALTIIGVEMAETYTITFCDRAENHVGMQQIGTLSDQGYEYNDLLQIQQRLDIYKPQLISLHSEDMPAAYILIISGVLDTKLLQEELAKLQWDTKAYMYGRVVNKRARHNLCFADFDQEPDYENRMGRIVSFASLPILSEVRDFIQDLTKDQLVAEGNRYYNDKCGIGYHGDTERRKVVGVRIGAPMPLVYQWYYQGSAVGPKKEFLLQDGDIYIMSTKATGFDWKQRKIYTLRHAAGASKYTS